VRGGQADHAAARIGAVEAGIGAAIDLGALDGGGGERTKVELPPISSTLTPSSRIVVGIRVAAAHKQRGLRAQLAGLHHNRAGHQPQRAHQIVRRARSSGPSTLVASLVCGCGVGVPVAVTTIDSRTHSGSSTMLRSTESSRPA
jgi:hypothetical protein